MTRIVKRADERRAEIIDAAQALFMRRGYDATTINDILTATCLSKGAFYHHFASKTEVLDALSRRMANEDLTAALKVFERKDLGPIERLNLFFGGGNEYKKENAAALRAAVTALYRDENLRLRLSATGRRIDIIAPRLAELLDEGRASGVFDIDDPAETARLLLHLGRMIHEALSTALRLAPARREEAIALCRRRIEACERAVERVLGVAKNSLAIVAPDMVERFLEIGSPAPDGSAGAQAWTPRPPMHR